MSIHLMRDLEALHRSVLSMCAIVEELVNSAMEDLGKPFRELSQDLEARDDEIDRWDVQIEEDCLKILALHQPVAVDLRRITTVLKISAELERVADLAVNISERARGLAACPEITIPDRLHEMATYSLEMLHHSIDSFVELDSDLARDVCNRDDHVDQLNREIIDELIEYMRKHPEQIEAAIQLFSASRHVERVADHATNIAEDVVYLVEGQIIRHRRNLQS
ncbi:MAG: phosphate signaling complex protein PhoU [Planctomycetales bacterium]